MGFRHIRVVKSLVTAVLALSPFALFTPVARADTIYSTFGPGNTFDTLGFSVQGPDNLFAQFGPSPAQDIAGFFAVTQAFTFDGASAALRGSPPNDPGVVMQLVHDDGGHPGALIEDLGSHSVTPIAAVITYTSSTHPLLTPGNYWLVATPVADDTTAAWRRSLSNFFNRPYPTNYYGEAFMQPPDATWTVYNDPVHDPGQSLAPAFEIDGTLAPAAVPLPASLPAGLLLLTLAAAPLARRWVSATATTTH